MFPLPNNQYDLPLFRINFIEEVPLKINKFIGNEKEEEKIEISILKKILLKKIVIKMIFVI